MLIFYKIAIFDQNLLVIIRKIGLFDEFTKNELL